MSTPSNIAVTTRSCTSSSPDSTRTIGRRIGQLAEPGDVTLLAGPLGAGKTVFTQGVGEGLGVADQINSPTFVLMRVYQGRLPLYHYDLYRLSNIEQTVGREWQEVLYGDGISVVEWANLGYEHLPSERLLIEFRIESAAERVLNFSAAGDRYVRLLEAIACS